MMDKTQNEGGQTELTDAQKAVRDISLLLEIQKLAAERGITDTDIEAMGTGRDLLLDDGTDPNNDWFRFLGMSKLVIEKFGGISPINEINKMLYNYIGATIMDADINRLVEDNLESVSPA